MASKQLLRRLPLFAREGWSASVNSGSVGVGAGALPEVTHDILPIVSRDSADSPRPTPPIPGSSMAAGVHHRHSKLPSNSASGQTLGQWTHRLSHLAQPLQKPLGTLGVPAAATAADLTRTAWPALAIPPGGTTAAAGVSPSKQGPAIPTAIAAATLPAIADLIKQQQVCPSEKGREKDATISPASVLGSSGSSEASAATAVAGDAALGSQAHQPQPPVQPMPVPAPQPQPQMQQLPPQHPHHQQRRSSSGAGGAGGRGGGAASSSIQLNKHIMACRNTEELLALVQSRGAHFDYFNISTALARVPKLAAASGPGGPGGMANGYGGYAGAPPPPPPTPPAGAGNGLSSDGSGPLAHLGQGGSSSAGGVLPGDLHVDAAGRLLLDHLAALMVSQIHSFDARGLANSAWAFGKLKYVPAAGTSLPSVIAAAALRRMGEFSPQNLSNLVWSFVYMHHVDEALLAAAARYVVARVGEFKPQELANIVWAFASLGHRDEQMLHVVASQAQRIAPLFKEQELSNVLWALGKMGLRNRPDVLESLMAETRTKLPAFLPQGISNVAWALAAVGHVDELFLDRVVAQCGRQLGAFDVQALANLVWAMASLGYYQPHFLAAVVNECLGRGLDRLSPQNLSNILWGCATLGHRDPRMLSAWAAQTLEKLPSFEPQGLSNTAWAFARLGFHSPQLFQALAAASLHKIDGFTAQGLSNLAWALATAGHAQPRLFEALARQAAAMAPTGAFNAQNCSVTLWAAASLRHYDEALFDAMLRRLVAALEEGAEADGCEPQNVANALWAVARMGHALPAEVAAPLLRHVVALLPRMSQQELCNSMWAVAVMERMDGQLWAAFCDRLTRLPDISPEGMHQAYHAQLMFHSHLARAAGMPLSKLQALAATEPASGSSRGCLLPRLPEPLHTVAGSMWAASARDVHVSRFHQEVSGALAVAGVPHAVEWMTDDQHFSVDIGLQVNARPTAVEVNGAHHYASNDQHRSLGDTAVRRRLLQDRGWNVVDVGFADWESMGRTLAERGSNLVGRIAASLDDWDWRYVGLPQRSAAGAAAPPPAAVVAPTPQPAAAAAPSTAAAAALAAQQQQEQQQAAAAQALAAAMGLGPLFPSTAAAAMSAFSSVATPAGPALDLDLDLELAGLAGWSASSPFTELSALALAGSAAAANGAAQLGDRAASTGSAMDEAAVTAAVEAAEALGALPGGSLLLQQQVYDVLGMSRSAGMLAALQAQAAAQQAAALGHHHGGVSHPHGDSSDEQVVSDDDLERVVQFALA